MTTFTIISHAEMARGFRLKGSDVDSVPLEYFEKNNFKRVTGKWCIQTLFETIHETVFTKSGLNILKTRPLNGAF